MVHPIWNGIGTGQTENQVERRIASFPEEIVNRLVMFSIKGDTVLEYNNPEKV